MIKLPAAGQTRTLSQHPSPTNLKRHLSKGRGREIRPLAVWQFTRRAVLVSKSREESALDRPQDMGHDTPLVIRIYGSYGLYPSADRPLHRANEDIDGSVIGA